MTGDWTQPLFSDPTADAIGTACAFVTVIMASAGGIGGGGLLVPLYMLVLGLGRFAIPVCCSAPPACSRPPGRLRTESR